MNISEVKNKRDTTILIEHDTDKGLFIAKDKKGYLRPIFGSSTEEVISKMKEISESGLCQCPCCDGIGMDDTSTCQSCNGSGELLTYYVAK